MSVRASYTGGESFLLTQFREFYQEVVRWKRLAARDGQLLQVSAAAAPGALVMTGGPGAAPGALMLVGGGAVAGPAGAAGAAAAVTPSVAPATIWQALLGLLNRQEAEVRRTGGEYASAIYRRAQYVMAALADEIFLYLDWPGREAWRANLLEFVVFIVKTFIFLFVFIWLRGTLPRLRYDQFMRLGWKVLVPISLLWILLIFAVRTWRQSGGSTGALLVAVGIGVAVVLIIAFLVPDRRQPAEPVVELASDYPVPPLDLVVPTKSSRPKGRSRRERRTPALSAKESE